jgi:hypothetical protein
MSQERRRHDRTAAKEASVACTSADFASMGSPSHNLALRLLDMSSSGACLVTKGRLRQGVAVMVGIVLPRQRTKVLSRAVVRWSTTVESKGRTAHVTGLEFDKTIAELAPRAELPRPTAASTEPEPQRRHKRFVAEKVDIVCLTQGLLTKFGVKPNAARTVKDLSLGGAQIVTTKKLKAGDRVDLTLQFRYPAATVQAEGIVRWCRRDTLSLEPRWNVGVVFKQMDRESEGRLRTVEAILIDREPPR